MKKKETLCRKARMRVKVVVEKLKSKVSHADLIVVRINQCHRDGGSPSFANRSTFAGPSHASGPLTIRSRDAIAPFTIIRF